MANNTPKEIQEAAAAANLPLSYEDAEKLANGEQINFDDTSRFTATGRCQGVKVYDFGNGCGLYYIPPLTASYCCEL